MTEKKFKYVQFRNLRITKELLNAKISETYDIMDFRFSRILKKERGKLKVATKNKTFYKSKCYRMTNYI